MPSGDNCTTPATRYFYEPSASNCLSFEGGCGNAEQNNFASLRQCYDNCNPRSEYNVHKIPGLDQELEIEKGGGGGRWAEVAGLKWELDCISSLIFIYRCL